MVGGWQTKFSVSPGPGLLVLGPGTLGTWPGTGPGPDLGPGPGPELDNIQNICSIVMLQFYVKYNIHTSPTIYLSFEPKRIKLD